MCAFFNKMPVVHNDDPVRIPDRCQPMRDHNRGAVLRKPVEAFLDLLFRDRIQCGSCLIKDQDLRIFQENTGDRDALLLPAGQLCSALADVGIKPVRHLHDVIVDLRPFCCCHDILIRSARASVTDVFQDRISKDKDILLHDADRLPERADRHIAHILPVDAD